MMFYDSLFQKLVEIGQEKWSQSLQKTVAEKLDIKQHGNIPLWLDTLKSLPNIQPSCIDLKTGVTIGSANDIRSFSKEELIQKLQTFHPWRKGPYNFFGINIDTEWRSDWKWERISPHIKPLKGCRVLDVGCGNGYHGWRMRGSGAEFVLGIEPFTLSVMQFFVMQKYIADPNHHVIPIGIEELPSNLECFDTVFSMGVLYHRRSPIDHLFELKGALCKGGELVLETLVVEGDQNSVFMPRGRYAKMRNVWFLPSIDAMKLWLHRCGFKDVKCINVTETNREEQRSTEWMRFESLADFLDKNNRKKTIEGAPAPLRASFSAVKG